MVNVPFTIGDYITNGSSAGRVVEIVERDPRWKRPALRLANIGTEEFGGNVGMSDAVPDYLLSGWRKIPFEWTPVVGGQLQERYVWAAGYTRLAREVRSRVPSRVQARDEPCASPATCDVHGEGLVITPEREQGSEVPAAVEVTP
jgi:hypothetical protein